MIATQRETPSDLWADVQEQAARKLRQNMGVAIPTAVLAGVVLARSSTARKLLRKTLAHAARLGVGYAIASKGLPDGRS